MKIIEVTQARVTRTTNNQVEIDNGDGTKTTIDTTKNPNALSRDERGNLKVKRNTGNSSMNSNNKNQTNRPPRTGDRVELDDED